MRPSYLYKGNPHTWKDRLYIEMAALIGTSSPRSRNIELSKYYESLNLGGQIDGNIIFSHESFLPRSLDLNLTADIYGHSINFVEIGGRIEGVEKVAEAMFKGKDCDEVMDTDFNSEAMVWHWSFFCSDHGSGNVVILTKFSALAAQTGVILRTFGAANDKNFVKLTFLFRWFCYLSGSTIPIINTTVWNKNAATPWVDLIKPRNAQYLMGENYPRLIHDQFIDIKLFIQ